MIPLARWAFPDVWNGFASSLATAKAMLLRWPHLGQLTAAWRGSLTAVVAEHTRDVLDVPARAETIRSTADAWARFWTVGWISTSWPGRSPSTLNRRLV